MKEVYVLFVVVFQLCPLRFLFESSLEARRISTFAVIELFLVPIRAFRTYVLKLCRRSEGESHMAQLHS